MKDNARARVRCGYQKQCNIERRHGPASRPPQSFPFEAHTAAKRQRNSRLGLLKEREALRYEEHLARCAIGDAIKQGMAECGRGDVEHIGKAETAARTLHPGMPSRETQHPVHIASYIASTTASGAEHFVEYCAEPSADYEEDIQRLGHHIKSLSVVRRSGIRGFETAKAKSGQRASAKDAR